MIAKHHRLATGSRPAEIPNTLPAYLGFVMCPVFAVGADARTQAIYQWAYAQAQAVVRARDLARKWPAEPNWN
jgi:hypothetical protein